MWKTVCYTTFYIFYILRLDSVDSATFILPVQPKPEKYEHETGCYLPERDKLMAYNEIYSPQDKKSCVQYTCNEDGTIDGATCGVQLILDPCTRVPGNKSLPYPQCCDSASCPKPAVIEDPPVEIPCPEEPTELADTDNLTESDPPIGPPRPCPTCPYPPVNLDSVKEPAPSPSVDPESEFKPSPPDCTPVGEEVVDGPPPVATVNHGPVVEPSDSPPINVPPKRPPTDLRIYRFVYPTDVSDSTTASKQIPPKDSPRKKSVPVASLQYESSNSSIYHGPIYTNPVEPPVTSKS